MMSMLSLAEAVLIFCCFCFLSLFVFYTNKQIWILIISKIFISFNSWLRHGLLSDVSSVFLSHSFCMRSLTANDAKAFIRGNGSNICSTGWVSFLLFASYLGFGGLIWSYCMCSMEGHGNVFSGSASGKASHPEVWL